MSPGLAENKETGFHTREEGRKPAFTTRFAQRNPGGSQAGNPPLHHLSQTTSLGWSRCRAGLLTHGSTYSPHLPGKIPVAFCGFRPRSQRRVRNGFQPFSLFSLAGTPTALFWVRTSRTRAVPRVQLTNANIPKDADIVKSPLGSDRNPKGGRSPTVDSAILAPLLPDLDESSPRC